MKKIIGIALAAILALGALGAFAEESAQLGGVVLEVTESTVLINTDAYGSVLVNFDEETSFEGFENGIQAGTYVIVDYSGAMSRSMPPQIYATKIAMYVLSGTVIEVSDAGALVDWGDAGQILVRLQDDMRPLFCGCPVDVYYAGIMAMSYPPQVTALYYVTPTLSGAITELGDGYFLMTGDDEVDYRVNDDGGTYADTALNVGDAVDVYYSGVATDSLPPQIYAIAVFHAAE